MILKKLGRYELLRVIGKGAMGVVYEGRDPNLDRRVAIKTIRVESLLDDAAVEYEHRFRTEARSAARLQHPNVVSVYDADRDGDVAFLVMEYVEGEDLKHHLDAGVRYSVEQSLQIICDLLSALDYAHQQGIVHRDIKPANLLIESTGRVKLTDFGVARIQDAGEATRTGAVLGTVKYMSPEQIQGQKIDSRADLFSVGILLYQLLTGKRAFDGDNDFSVIHQIIHHTPPAPSSVAPRLPTALDAVVERALKKRREERFSTAREFAEALQAAVPRADHPAAVPWPKMNPVVSPPQTVPRTTVSGSMPTPSGETTGLVTVNWQEFKPAQGAVELQAHRHGQVMPDRAKPLAALAAACVRALAVLPDLVGYRSGPPTAGARKPPVAMLAGIAVVVVAILLAVSINVGSKVDSPPAAMLPSAVIGAAWPTAGPPLPVAPVAHGAPGAPGDPLDGLEAPGALDALHAPGTAPRAAAAPRLNTVAPTPGLALKDAKGAPAAPRKPAQPMNTTRAASTSIAPEPEPESEPQQPEPVGTTRAPRGSPDPTLADQPSPQVAAHNANYQAVDRCKDKFFLSRELCLSENCGKPGTRNHPLCLRELLPPIQ